jgi:putative tricarboxylic transport membrane protein
MQRASAASQNRDPLRPHHYARKHIDPGSAAHHFVLRSVRGTAGRESMSDQSDVKFRLNNSELWGGLIGLALGGFVVWSGLKLKLGTINDPGSGFVLFYTGILMCLFAASIMTAALTEGGPTFGSRWVNTRWTKPLLVIVCLIAFSFALNPLGFLLSSIPLMLLLLRVVDPVRWPLAVPIAVLVPLGMWWVLKRLLLIQLPSGIFEIG